MSSGNYIDFTNLTFKCSEETFNKILLELEKTGDFEVYKEKYRWNYEFILGYCDEDSFGYVELDGYEVSRHFEEDLEELNEILHKFGTQLEGFYFGGCDNDIYRADLKPLKRSPYIKTECEGARWVLDYSVEQIKELKKLAKKKFN